MDDARQLADVLETRQDPGKDIRDESRQDVGDSATAYGGPSAWKVTRIFD